MAGKTVFEPKITGRIVRPWNKVFVRHKRELRWRLRLAFPAAAISDRPEGETSLIDFVLSAVRRR